MELSLGVAFGHMVIIHLLSYGGGVSWHLGRILESSF